VCVCMLGYGCVHVYACGDQFAINIHQSDQYVCRCAWVHVCL